MKAEIQFEFDDNNYPTGLENQGEPARLSETLPGTSTSGFYGGRSHSEMFDEIQVTGSEQSGYAQECKATRTQVALLKAGINLMIQPNTCGG